MFLVFCEDTGIVGNILDGAMEEVQGIVVDVGGLLVEHRVLAQKHGFLGNFGRILGDIHIIKMLQQKMLGCTL